MRRRLAGGAVAFVVIVSAFALANRALSPPSQDMARGREVPGVAVLPLAGEPRLSEQITRRLIETLQQTGLRTQGWLSVSRFAEGAAEPRLLGEQLGVSYLIEGRALRDAERLELSVSLIDARDGFVLWTETLSGTPQDLRDLEIQVAETTVQRLVSHHGSDPEAFPVPRYTQSVTADSLYRLGMYLQANSYNPVTHRRAAEAFRGAIAADTTFAPAYVALASTLFQQSRIFWESEPREQVPEVLELLLQAERLEHELASTYTAHGWYHYGYSRDYERAMASHQRAIQLAPNQARAYTSAAFPLAATGQVDSAVAMMRRARDLEPLNPLIASTECWIQFLVDRLEQALETCEFVTDSLDAQFKVALDIQQLVRHLLMVRRGDTEGLAASRLRLEASPPHLLPDRQLYFEQGLAWYWAVVGDTAQALATLEKEKNLPGVRPLRIASGYAAIGHMDSAFTWLDLAIEARDPYVPEIAVRPTTQPFREDPRFPAYVERLGLEDYFPEFNRPGD